MSSLRRLLPYLERHWKPFWLGIGGLDLFDTYSALRAQFPCADDATSLLGIGAGATGALQLACWFPDRFAALALIAPWADDRQDLPLGVKDWPEWEKAQRRAVSPLALVGNLDEIPILHRLAAIALQRARSRISLQTPG